MVRFLVNERERLHLEQTFSIVPALEGVPLSYDPAASTWPGTKPLPVSPTSGQVPTAEVEAALALADFDAESWEVWKVDPKAEHPRRPTSFRRHRQSTTPDHWWVDARRRPRCADANAAARTAARSRNSDIGRMGAKGGQTAQRLG
jgi:hypothetical protein